MDAVIEWVQHLPETPLFRTVAGGALLLGALIWVLNTVTAEEDTNNRGKK